MPHDIPLKSATLTPREVPHTVSPGLWTLAWRRLKTDYVGTVSLAIVAIFVALMILSGFGLIASDWSKETGVNYAPPSFLGADYEGGTPAAPAEPAAAPTPASEYKSQIVDPIADVITQLKTGKTETPPTASPSQEEEKSVDPLADIMAEIRGGKAKTEAAVEQRKATLPLGGDKWGRDVLKKTIKGSETSIFVGIASAIVATFRGTAFGALAGYY